MSMKKAAIFVEGQTERIFIEWMLDQLVKSNRLYVEAKRLFGSKKGFGRIVLQARERANPNAEFYVLIVDSGGESSVVSDLNDQYQSLVAANHSVIIALRDVAPNFEYEDRQTLQAAIEQVVASTPVKPLIVLATMETEAWFIAECSHFKKLNPGLNIGVANTVLGIDVTNDDIEQVPRPSISLQEIYATVGLTWDKSETGVKRTVNLLDLTELELAAGSRVVSLAPLLEVLRGFMS